MGVFAFTFLHGNISFLMSTCFYDFYIGITEFVLSVYIVAMYCFYIITVAVNFIVIIIILYISNIIVIIVIIIIIFALFFRFTLIAMLSLLLVYYQSLLKKLNLVRLVPWTTLHLVLYEIRNLYKKILCIDNGSSWNIYMYIYIYIYIYHKN